MHPPPRSGAGSLPEAAAFYRGSRHSDRSGRPIRDDRPISAAIAQVSVTIPLCNGHPPAAHPSTRGGSIELADGCRKLPGPTLVSRTSIFERRLEIRVAAGSEVASCRVEGSAARWRFPTRWAIHAAAGVSSRTVTELVSRYADRLEVPRARTAPMIDLEPPRGWVDWAREIDRPNGRPQRGRPLSRSTRRGRSAGRLAAGHESPPGPPREQHHGRHGAVGGLGTATARRLDPGALRASPGPSWSPPRGCGARWSSPTAPPAPCSTSSSDTWWRAISSPAAARLSPVSAGANLTEAASIWSTIPVAPISRAPSTATTRGCRPDP